MKWKIRVFSDAEAQPDPAPAPSPITDNIYRVVELLGPILGIVFLYLIILTQGLTPIISILGFGALALGFAVYLIITIIRNRIIDLRYFILIFVFMVFAAVILLILKTTI